MTNAPTHAPPITYTLTCPFTVLIDAQEKAPFSFTGLHSNAATKRQPLTIPTRWQSLATGDYSIDGLAELIAVERKSPEDLYGTIISGTVRRGRFIRELERLNAMQFTAVVVERSLGGCLQNPPDYGKMAPANKAKSLYGSILAWQQRYPGVHWVFCDDRRLAEVTTFRVLERFWREREAAGMMAATESGVK